MFSFLFCCWFLTVCGKRVKGVLCSQNPCVFFSYVYVDLNVVVFIFGVFFVCLVPVKSINTSGMSITLLIKQNVYRYYALTDTLSLLFTRHQERFRFTCHLF